MWVGCQGRSNHQHTTSTQAGLLHHGPRFHLCQLVNFVHLARVIVVVLVLEIGKVIVAVALVIVVVDRETELDETVDAVGEGHGLVEGEARSEEGGVVEEPGL